MEIRTDGNIRYFSGNITPGEGIVMVFGSNPEGRHGAGAAKVARERFGAVYGQGEGLQGNAYALPTKDLRVKENRSLRSISPEAITENIKRLYDTARQNPDKTFCIAYRNTDRQSLNGYTGIEMMRMFNAAGQMPDNVVVSKEWADTGLLRRASESEYLAEGNDNILKQYDAYRVIGPGVNLAVDTRMDNIRDWFEIVDDNGERIVRAANYVQELREYESAHFENPVVGPDGSVTLDAIAHVIYPEGEVETSEMAHPVKFSAQELQELVSERKIRESETRKVATDKDIVLSSDGKPLVLWHGSPAEFEEFDFSHAGDNTGLVEYTNRETGEKVLSDSDKAIFFTDNRELAISYGFLARTQELSHLTGLMTDIISCLRDPEHSMTDYIKSKKDLIEAAQTLRRENDPEVNAFLDRLPDLNGERPISSMDAGSREELRNELIQIRTRYNGYWDMNRNGGISNRLNNFVRMKDYLQYFVGNFDRLCEGDTTVMTEHGDNFNHYNQGFYSSEGNIGISIFIGPDEKELMVSGYKDVPVLLTTLSPDQRKEILQRIEDDLNTCIENYNAELEESGYRKHTHLYPVYLKAKSPLVHDYQGSAFPDKYKPNEKYSTAYIAARQVKKALADGNDAVVYKNIRDPFLGDTYGVFSKDSIVMLDKNILPEEQLDSTLGKVSGTVQRYMDSLERKNMEQRELRFIEDISGLMDREFIPKYDTHAQNELLKAVCRYHGDSVSFPPETHLTWSVAGDNGIDYESEYEVFIDKMYVDNDEIFCDGSLDNGRTFEHRLLRDEKPYYDFILDLAPEGLLYPLTVLNGGDTLSSELFQKVLDYRKNINETTMDENVKKAIQFEKELKSNLNVRYKSSEEYYYEREDNWDVIRYKAFESTLKDAINDHYPNDVVFEWAMMHVADMKADEKQVDVALKCEEFYESFLCGDKKEENQAVNEIEKKNGNNTSPVSFVEDDSPYYKERTRRNAEAADVTVAFALDFNTAGERCTKNVAGDRYIAISLPPQNYFKEPDTKFSKSLLKEKVEMLEAAIMVRSQEHGFPFVGVNVNVAGNGLYTLAKHGVSQADVDRFVTDVFRQLEKRPNVHVRSIRSGGQTGIDEAGIKAAVALDIPATVLAPHGWKFRDENGNDISDEKAFKARFPEAPVKENGLKPLTEEEMLQTRGGVRIDEPEKQPESGMKPLSEEEMKTIRGGVEIAPQQAPQPVDAFRRIAEAAVSSGKVRSVGELRDGWALVQANNGKFNYTNDKGKFMTKNWFDSATEFSKGVAIIKRDGCTARINMDGIAVEVVNNMAQRTGNSPKIG